MKQEAPIGRADVRAAVLPSRAAYLVPAGDREAFVVAVREACTRWAGATEPIVPVRAGGKVDGRWTQVVELGNVDGLVSVNLSSTIAEQVASRLGLPVIDIARIDQEGATQFSIHPRWLAPVDPARRGRILGDGISRCELVATRSCWRVLPPSRRRLVRYGHSAAAKGKRLPRSGPRADQRRHMA